jgi:ubiquinol-cytochrome c reductase cytochrome b subunit
LKGFASREWLAGLLDPEHVATTNYFGATKFHQGRMARFVRRDIARFTPEEKEKLVSVIAAVSAEAGLPSQTAIDVRDAALIEQGRAIIRDEFRCAECHQFRRADNTADAPDLTGYGSRQWLVDFVSNPAHSRFYGESNDRMPAYRDTEVLSLRQIELIVDWLRGDWYEPEVSKAHR